MTALITPTPSTDGAGEPSADTATAARMSLRDGRSRAGYMDGAWWPRSNDLAAELPELVRALAAAGRRTSRVSFHLDSWAPAPRRIVVDGRAVKLSGFRYQSPSMVTAIDSITGTSADLLVIAPDTAAEVSQTLMRRAAAPDNALRPNELLAQVVA